MISFNQGNESFSLPSNSDCISEAFEMKTESDSISSNKYKYPTISPTESMKNRQLPFFDYEKKINYSSYTEAEINESDIRRLYFIDNSKKTSEIFVIEPEKSKNIKNIRRGRKKEKIGNKKIHDKYVVDNLLRKIQVHFLSFIISFLNDILKHLNYKQKQSMLESVRKMVEEFKDEPYILMWMLGNENDVSGNFANSTATNTNAWKEPEAYAKFLEEACKLIKDIDEKKHPVGVCNATTKLVKYYAQYTPSIDVLGFNQYAGPYGFGTLWKRIRQEYDKPILITEYGCDAWNSNKNITCEVYQASYHKGAWKDIENNSYWGNKEGNSIGGCAYCWLDRWWLVGSPKIHDTSLGAWRGSTIDGLFNDEWLGFCSQGNGKNSPFQRILRKVYYTYQEELWDWDPATYR